MNFPLTDVTMKCPNAKAVTSSIVDAIVANQVYSVFSILTAAMNTYLMDIVWTDNSIVYTFNDMCMVMSFSVVSKNKLRQTISFESDETDDLALLACQLEPVAWSECAMK